MRGREEKRTQFCHRKPEGKRPLGRSRCRLEDPFKWELQIQRLNLFGSEKGPIIGVCGHCNTPSVDTK